MEPITWLPKLIFVWERLAAGPAPVPVRLTLPTPEELPGRPTLAVRLPDTAGVKVTLMVQLAPAARLVPQLFVSAKSVALLPKTARLLTLNATLLVFVKVVCWAEPVLPRDWVPKLRLVGEKVAEGGSPVPLRFMVAGVAEALSVMVSVAVRVPVAVGLKVTKIVQLEPAEIEVPHVLASEKAAALVPVTAMLVMVRDWSLLSVSVTDCAELAAPCVWLAKVRLLVDRATPAAVPVPDRPTVWGLPEALSVNTTEAVRAPAALGVNVTLSVHCAEGARVEPQVLVSEKSLALGPVTWTLEMFKVAVPTFVRVSV